MSNLCLIDPDGLEMAAMKYNENHPDSPLTRNDFKLIDRFLSEYPTIPVCPLKECPKCGFKLDGNNS